MTPERQALAELVAATDEVSHLGEGTVGGRSEEELAANLLALVEYERPIRQRLEDAWAAARAVLAQDHLNGKLGLRAIPKTEGVDMSQDLPVPLPPNESGSSPMLVRWQITLPSGNWVGAWDKEAFDEYDRACMAPLQERVRELEAELALRRKSGSATDRLHNLCEGIAADADGSEWSREEWERLDAENGALRAELSRLKAQEPVAWIGQYEWSVLTEKKHGAMVYPDQTQPEPYARPLYTAPPSQEQT